MPWCPKCGTEYVKGIKECADCGEPLVEELGGKAKSEKPGKNGMGDHGNEVFLYNLSGPIELSYIESIFEEEGIPYRLEDSDMGLYLEALMGSSFFGKNVFVGENDFERASAIIESFKAQPVIDESEDYAEDEENE